MRVLFYEFITGGGCWSLPGAPRPRGSLLREGAAMARAVIDDLARIEGCRVTVPRDVRLSVTADPAYRVVPVDGAPRERDVLVRHAADADWTILIAPEFRDLLLERCLWCGTVSNRVLPDAHTVSAAADKNRTQETLAAAGVPTPPGRRLDSLDSLPHDFRYPAVLKPAAGAGSTDVRYLPDGYSLPACGEALGKEWRIEEYCAGTAVSVAVLNRAGSYFPLPACLQKLSGDGRFRYLGGVTPIAGDLDRRARRLAVAAAGALSADCGYLGVDLVLGEDASGDRVIEVNPRITTSYVGLRRLTTGNIIQSVIRMAEGKAIELPIGTGTVTFDSSGRVRTREEVSS